MIYVSAPYTHPEINVIDNRMLRVTKYSAYLLLNRYHLICPLTMGHAFSLKYNQPNNQDFWLDWCYNLLKRCDEMHVLMIDGWKESNGVQKEITFAIINNIPIKYIESQTIENLIK